MREGWTRGTPILEVEAETAERLINPVFPGTRVTGIEPVSGGLANTNLRVTITGRDSPLLLRLYQRARRGRKDGRCITSRRRCDTEDPLRANQSGPGSPLLPSSNGSRTISAGSPRTAASTGRLARDMARAAAIHERLSPPPISDAI